MRPARTASRIAVAIITAFPQIVMWLPKYVFPG